LLAEVRAVDEAQGRWWHHPFPAEGRVFRMRPGTSKRRFFAS